MADIETSVLIVGAGPAGLATAIGLAQRGIDFVTVDAKSQAEHSSRAAVVHAATLDSLRPLGVADRLSAQGIRVPHFRIRDRDRLLIDIDFGLLPVENPFAVMIPQDETEAILVERLTRLGHTVRRPVRLVRCAAADHGVTATCEGAGGSFAVAARYIVGADGERSAVRASAGIGFPGRTHGSFLLADVRMDWPLDTGEVTLFFASTGMLVVAPMSRDRFRVVAQLADAPSQPSVADVQRLLDARGPRRGVAVRELLWGSRFQVHHRLADRMQAGPVLLVGDAAHVHSPAGGQGMNLGLRDAVALADALDRALREGGDAALRAYGLRRDKAAEVLAMTDRLTRAATVANPALRWVRNMAIRALGRAPRVRRLAALRLAGYR